MNIVFMGTPEFSVPCLQRLMDDGNEVSGVFTQPDKPKGRGNVMTPPPVKVLALENGIEVFQPRSMRDGEALSVLERLKPELVVVVAFGKILPKEILDFPKYGCINIHASLLPRYRGAAPIQWSVINGESKTGVTSMLMDVGLDTGDMLISSEIEIGENDTAGDVHDRLSALGAQILSQTVKLLPTGTLERKKQDNDRSNYAPMLTKELCPIDWKNTALQVHNKIRGLSPWPVATAMVAGKELKIHSSSPTDDIGGKAGEIMCSDERLVVSCGDGKCVQLLVVQAQGKKAMPAADFLRGNKIERGMIL